MHRTLFAGVLAFSGLTVLATNVPARAIAIALPANPGPARALQADAVVVGRVVAMEDKDIQVQNVTYRIAVVQVTETVKGTKEAMVKVGFIPPATRPGGPAIRPPIGGRFGGPQFQVGQDGLFFLHKGPDGKFFTAPQYYSFVSGQVNNFQQEITTAKLAIKIGNQPLPALKAGDPQERLFAASLLIQKYRGPRINAKQEPIDAEESKLIMKALATANWTPQNIDAQHPYQLFNQLGVTAADGWTRPVKVRDFKEIIKSAHEWVEKNAETYRIKAFVGGQPIGRPGISPLPVQPPVRILPVKPGQVRPALPPAQVRPGVIRPRPVEPAPAPPPADRKID